MKRTLLIVLLVLIPAVAHAQTSFILGMAVGASMASGQDTTGAASPMLLYRDGAGIQGVQDPMAVRTVSVEFNADRPRSLWSLFLLGEPLAAQMHLLQVVYVPRPDGGYHRVLFFYVPRETR